MEKNKYNLYIIYYRKENVDEIVYVGQTKKELRKRILQHIGNNGFIKKEMISKIRYAEVDESEVSILENALISKYRPELNTKDKAEYNVTERMENIISFMENNIEFKELGIDKLENENDSRWEYMFFVAKEYIEKEGIEKLTNKIIYKNENIGAWISNQRGLYKRGRLPKKRKEKLDNIGVIWDKNDFAWENGFLHASNYFKKNKNLHVAAKYKCEDGFGLGYWISSQRNKYKNMSLPIERKRKLDRIGMIWEADKENWDRFYKKACDYYEKNNDINASRKELNYFYNGLGNWLWRQRKKYINTFGDYKIHKFGILSDEQIQKLEKLNIKWEYTIEEIEERRVENVKRKISKPVINVTTGKKYSSATEAEKETGINAGCICGACSGKAGRKTAGGCIWKYIDKNGNII